ncbi:MAG: diphosphomevalonate decarboxylase [Myxococcales bacterium]|nr:diphosphomevalonate decarboxylase [Myxococcales bacterium]
MTASRAAAFAPINIALVKYWGKRDAALNLPVAPSLSVALQELGSLTIVQPDAQLDRDIVVVDDRPLDPAGLVRAERVLAAVRRRAGATGHAGVRSVNTVPMARGLASSASGMAALAVAAARAYGLDLSPAELSALARLGSGSAARSVPGGFALWHAGSAPDGSDSVAECLHPAEHWPLRVLVAHVGGRKAVSSTAGMASTAASAPMFEAWTATCRADVATARNAIAARDFGALADVVECNALRMHATMLWGRPPLLYWQPATVAVIHAVRQLRHEGTECCFTIDAGASVVILATAQDVRAVAEVLGEIAGIDEVIETRVGPGARVVESGA